METQSHLSVFAAQQGARQAPRVLLPPWLPHHPFARYLSSFHQGCSAQPWR